MAVILSQENSSSVEAIYKWIQSKLGIGQDENMKASNIEGDNIQNKYSPRYIANLLPEKNTLGIASFHFSNTRDYLTLSSNGQLNVRDGEEDLFRAWGEIGIQKLISSECFSGA